MVVSWQVIDYVGERAWAVSLFSVRMLDNIFVERSKSYVPSLDGLRAFAVLSVIAYHMKATWATGGLLGVTMFFVLSGYLITGLLLKEYDERGTISLKNFWVRRVRRIIPAVLFAVLGTAFLCTLFDHALLTKMRPDVIPTLLFVNNWWQIFHNVSYFAALGEPSPLTHYWSLAIEEQFYLVWPVVLLVCMKLGVRKSVMQKGTIVLAILSALEMILLFDPAQDPSRVYYGTDTRAFSLLIGSCLAFMWPYRKLTKRAGNRMTPGGRLAFNLVGVAAVIGLVIMVVVTNGFAPFIYRGGLLLCSLLTAVAIAVMVHPISWIGEFFRLRPLVWVGKCSYSMYLWHYPIILLMTPNNLVGEAPIWLRLVQLVVIFAVSAFSFYVVEDPIRKGAIGRLINSIRNGEFTLPQWLGSHLVPAIVAGVFVLVPIGGLALVPDTGSVQNTSVMGQDKADPGKARDDVKGSSGTSVNAGDEYSYFNVPYDIVVIGDSVTASLEGYGVFYDYFPYGHIDAEVSRPFAEAIPLYQSYRDAGAVGDVLVFALGTNGYVSAADVEALMREVGDKQRVWFINTRSQTDFMEDTNAALAQVVGKYDNAELIDWYGYSGTLGEDVFDGDGTHPTIDGCRTYAQMITDAVSSYMPKHAKDEKTRDERFEEAKAAAPECKKRVTDFVHGVLA